MDDQDWYEKDLNDFAQPEIIQAKQKRSSKSISTVTKNSFANELPFDVWYLLGLYIAPEDIGRFALICRTTNHVVNTIAFWISMLRKYNPMETKRLSRILMKEHLSIVRTYVIKSFYQNYPLFQKRLNKTDAIQKDPHFLLSSRCIRIWYSKRSTPREVYHYYFEFRSDSTPQEIEIPAISPLFRLENQYKIDQNTWILHVISSNFVPIGPYMGMILSKLTLNVSSDYRYHKLKMWFDSSRLSLQKSNYNNAMIIIDPILCLRLYKWYNIPAHLD